MRVTGPGLRRRNHAWLEMRSRERRWTRRQIEEESETSDSGGETSGDESGEDSSDDEEDTVPTVQRPSLPLPTVGAGAGVNLLPVPGATLGADEGEESASDGIDSGDEDSPDEAEGEEESTVPPAAGPPAPTETSTIGAPVPTDPAAIIDSSSSLPGSASSTDSASSEATSTKSISSGSTNTQTSTESALPSSTPIIDDVLTSISADSTSFPTLALPEVSPTPPATNGATTSEEEQLGASPSRMNTGAAVGIVIGTLAIIGCLIGAALFWRKWRRDRGLPFLPAVVLPWKKDRNDNYDSDATLAPGKGGDKTNTAIMDDLMKAAYAAEHGNNDMEFYGGYPGDQKDIHPNMIDEKAYVALTGHLTPGTPKKPVSTWLGGIVTPRQSQGPVFPPSPMYSEAERPPMPTTIPGTMAVPKLQPPPPAKARTTMTTDTTNTSVRWYG
ncbi:hypothetical protein QBC36DRAFT_109031 [Triangularia setosa]|uniref:Uncharacterized protein n=1 Tax=Triangularia setosa TaxID=2587417 RepID=A0AAN6WA97_9PEZI|nr:hypothetical protein QBC36DRAFT_109031 [Podospora setosa]